MSKANERFDGKRMGFGNRAGAEGSRECKSPLDWVKFWLAQIVKFHAIAEDGRFTEM